MSSDLQKYLSTQLNEAQSKYIYFLLAVAASAIALVVQRTTGRCLNWNMLPLGMAILCWGASFWAGCLNRRCFSSNLILNIDLLKIRDGSHPLLPDVPGSIDAGIQIMKEIAEGKSSKANFWGNSQFNLLVLGAVFFLAWHIIEMSKIDIASILFHQ